MAKLDFPGYEDFSFIPYPPFIVGTETLEFFTDVVLTHDGSEDRTRNRAIARQSLSYKVRTDLLTRQSPFNLSLQNIRGNWGVPQWQEAQFVGTVSGTSINCEIANSDFRVGNLVLIYQNNKRWEVAEIFSIGTSSILLTSSVGTYKNALVLPISQGIIRGDITNGASGAQSVYGMLYNILDPKPFPTKLGVVFAIDNSGSMSGDRMASVKAQIIKTLDALKGAVVNSNVVVDLGISFFSRSAGVTSTWPLATEADFEEAVTFINDTTDTGYDEPELAFEYANDFFGVTAPNPGDRKDIMFFMTDATANTNAAAIEGADLLAHNDPFDGVAEVDIYAVNIDLVDPTQALKVDNASDGNIAVVNTETPNALYDRFIFAIEPVIGKQHKGFEFVTAMPVGSSGNYAKAINKIEDDVDYDLGRFETLSPWLKARVGGTVGYFLDGLDEIADFKRFLYRRAGKLGSFYLASYEHDVRFTDFSEDMLSGFIQNDDFASLGNGRRQLAIRFTNDDWQTVEVTSVTPNVLGGYTLEFEEPIEQGLRYIERVCYMGKARFDTDRIELQYVGNNCAEANVNMLEI